MRRQHRERVHALRGQLLFADLQAGKLTLDCVLGKAGAGSSSPVTFAARFPGGARSAQVAIELLQEWADHAALVDVVISDRRAGALVEISSDSGRVVLEPDD